MNIKTKKIKPGSRTLNDTEITLIAASIKKAVAKRVLHTRNYVVPEDYVSFCYQAGTRPGCGCMCDTCDVVMQTLEKLRPTQESAFRLFNVLKRTKVWFTDAPVLQFCEPYGFRTKSKGQRGQREWVQREWVADINKISLDTIIDAGATTTSSNICQVLQFREGSFEEAKKRILDRVKGRKVRNVGRMCRVLVAFALVEQEKTGKTVTIHVDEIRRRLRKRQYGDLIRIVSRIGPQYIETDDDFNQLLAMKWLGSGDRTRHAAVLLAQRFKRAGKSIGGNTANACLT